MKLIAEVRESAAEWGISGRIVWLVIWLPVVGALALAMTRVNRSLYDVLTREDGPIEWAQFAFYAGASLASAGVAIKRLASGHRWQALLYMGIALAALFIAGEEIAWGQRIFGLQTPEQLSAINHQRELTVHNIQIVQDAFNVVLMLAGAYGSVAYFANKRIQVGKYWDQANYLLVPPLFTVPSFLVLFGYKLARFLVWRTPGFTVTRFAEWAELCFALALFLWFWLNYRRLAVQTAQPVAVQTVVRP